MSPSNRLSGERSTPRGAVFLSYASQDVEAARRIADALRAAGVEVWFDQSELVGGDAWDVKIRGQIAECALFVPVISANTQARLEGYFRLVWKLAAQRTHTMADEKAFLLPVVIDTTRDAEAKVPAEFKAVQWTRLRPAGYGGQARPSEHGGQALDDAGVAAFCGRVKKLLGDAAPEAVGGGLRSDGFGNSASMPEHKAPPAKTRRVWPWLALAATAGLGVLFAPRLRRSAAEKEAPSQSSNLAVANDNAVAVLPFKNLSGDQEQEYFSEGLTEDILNALARERDLRVPGRTSSFSFKGKNVSAAEIAKALNVSRLVEGSVQRIGNLVRIRITLTRASDGFSEAFPTFDKELTNGAAIFALQDEVARAVVQRLTQRAPTRAVAVPTSNAAAYDLFLQGRAIVARGLAGADRAEALFQRAVDLDPNFALGWAHLAEATFRNYAGMMDRSPERAEKTRAAIDRALALQPDLPEALIARADWERHVKGDYAAAKRDLARVETLRAPTGQLRYIQTYVERDMGNWAQALRYAEEAIQLDPQNGAYTYGFAIAVHGAHGDFAGADRLTARGMAIQGNGLTHAAGLRVSFRFLWRGPAAALRLLDGIPAVKDEDERRELYRAVLLYELGRPDEARATLAPIEPLLLQDVPEPGGTFGYRSDPVMALNCLLLLGRTETARTLTSRMRAFAETEMRRGNRTGTMRLLLIKAQVASGQRDEALAALQEWRRDSRATTNAFQRIRNFNDSAAMLYAALGRADEAIELLRELPSVGLRNLVSLRYQPDFAPIRNDPRFQELMRAQEAWAAAQPDPVEP